MFKELYAVVFVFGTFVTCAKADVIFGYDFESPMNLNTASGVNGVFITNMTTEGVAHGSAEGPGYLSRRSEVVALGGDRSFRFGLSYQFDYRHWNDGTLQKPRSAITWGHHVDENSTARLQVGKEYWLGMAYYFPEDYIFDYRTNVESLFQLHKVDGRRVNGRYTPNAVNFILSDENGDNLCNEFKIRFMDYFGDSASPREVSYWFPVTRGVWHQLVLHFKFTHRGAANEKDGFFEVYLDGGMDPVFSVSGPNAWGFADTNSPTREYKVTPNFYKYNWHSRANESSYTGSLSDARGDYEFAMSNPNTTYDDGTFLHSDGTYDRFFYVDNIFLGDANSSIIEVAPAWPSGTGPLEGVDLSMQRMSEDRFRVRWTAEIGIGRVEQSADLLNWSLADEDVVEGTEGNYIEVDSVKDGSRVFYRIIP